jgi:hypothetical protein
MADASTAQTEKDRARETQSLTTAAQLYTDDLLPALYDDWLIPLREDYRRRISEVLHRLATLLEDQKDYAAAIPCTERLIALDSLNESSHRLLIRLHAANNDRASALRAYHQCMRRLRREMGVEPSPATLELFERILKAGPEAPREPTSGSPESAALQPIAQLQKARALVGRTMEWHQLATVWQLAVEGGPRVALISGEPGIGKTRLADELYESCVRQGYAAARSRCYAGQGQVPYAPVAEWLRHRFAGSVLRASLAPAESADWLKGTRVVAWAGIGAPERFFTMLRTLGADVAETRAFRDHQWLGEAEAGRLLELAQRHGATLVTTAKDMARITGASGACAELAAASRVLPVKQVFAEPDAERLTSLVDTALKARR